MHTRGPVWPPDGIADEVRHVVVQILDQVEDIVDEEDGIVIAIQDPLVVLHAVGHVCNEGRHCSPVDEQAESLQAVKCVLEPSVKLTGLSGIAKPA